MRKPYKRWRTALVAGCAMASACWHASAHSALFLVRDQNPLVLALQVPPLDLASSPASGIWSAGAAFSRSNTFNDQHSSREHLFVDAETTVVDLWGARAVTKNTSIWIHAPLISHSAGSLDGFIERYHSALGLPEGERVGFPRDRLDIRYERDGKQLIALQRATSGLGDLSLGVSRGWSRRDSHRGQVAATLKLATGDADDLTGSGGAALGLSGAAEHRIDQRWSTAWRVGAQWLQQGELLPDQQRSWAAFGAVGIEHQLTPTVALGAQLDLHTGLYRDTQLRMLREALTLTLGGRLKLDPRWSMDIAVMEDAHVEAAPDVTLHVALRRGF